MNISNNLLTTLEIALDTIFKASGTDIRLHGLELIPDQPVLYVVNHFTRMETFLMPYILKKNVRKYPISLADSSFFSGKMGEFMDRVGAISTADKNRNAILIGALLTDSHPVIIFPEGQMIKDKKIIEKGKFMVYNTGIRRPPHTGAARIALLSQFMREKIRRCHEKNDAEKLAQYAAAYGFDPADAGGIIGKETFIVPVNLTYYPVRARDNAINKVVGRFVKDMSARFKEELQVEGTMVMEGVDIDINFGRPISAKEYLHSSAQVEEMLADEACYLSAEEAKKLSALAALDLRMMHEYMNSIYGMTTVNHDHIFSYILTRHGKSWISEDDLKNRAFLAIDIMRRTGITNYHTALQKKQFYLLTDDYHEKYANFVESAAADGLITVRDGIIHKNRGRFTKVYDFHTIRKDNIIEVLRNEIEPLTALTRALDRICITPAWWIRRTLARRFIDLDRKLFEDDYRKFYIKGETKPEEIGRPFFLKRFFSRRGIILIHGYMAAPEEIRPLADYLHKKGYNVYGARLRGHGTAPEDLASRNWEKWYDSVGRAYIIMKNTMKTIAIGGFSTGAGIALLQAANKPGRFRGVISINAPLKLQNISSRLSSAVVMWNNFLTRIKISRGKMDFVTNTPENPHINYFRNPVAGVSELGKLMKVVEGRLLLVKDPALIMQGSDDPVVNPVSGLEIFDRLGTEQKQLIRIYAKHHGIIRGREFEEVKARTLEFLKKVFSR
ncbi:MAG TPA: alpha/beta hydrolase [Spirochaetota bacterium]|nr:alpha/beta hydrolase [Spirochaetota bacterium]